MQAIMYEDSIFTRTSHFSYEIKNNKLDYPSPEDFGVDPFRIWFNFYVREDSTDDSAGLTMERLVSLI